MNKETSWIAHLVSLGQTVEKKGVEPLKESQKQWQASGAKTRQVGGDHYKKGIQPVDFAFENGFDCYQFSINKYITRHKEKGGLKDLLKALHFLEMYIETLYGEEALTMYRDQAVEGQQPQP